jgi:hypothetical protein
MNSATLHAEKDTSLIWRTYSAIALIAKNIMRNRVDNLSLCWSFENMKFV